MYEAVAVILFTASYEGLKHPPRKQKVRAGLVGRREPPCSLSLSRYMLTAELQEVASLICICIDAFGKQEGKQQTQF